MHSTTLERLALCRRVSGLPALQRRNQLLDADELATRWWAWRANRQLFVPPPSAARSAG